MGFSQQNSAASNGQAAYAIDGITKDESKRWAANTQYPQGVEIAYTGTFISLNEVRLSVTVPLTSYESWSAGIPLGAIPHDQRLPTADPDADAANDFLEYALGSVPTDAASVNIPTSQI